MSKRLIALFLALVLCVGMLAACGGNGDETTAGNDDTTAGTNGGDDTTASGEYVAPNMTGVKITQYMPDNSDYNPEDTWLNKQVEEYLGLDLNIIEGADVNNMIAGGKAPELEFTNAFDATFVDTAKSGAYVNIYDHLDKMPNVKAYLEDPVNAEDVAKFLISEGELYNIPVHQDGGSPSTNNAFLYRKDIFEKNNLTFPTNQDEFYETLKTLKTLYPESYPFVLRRMSGNIQGAQGFGHLWGGIHLLTGNYSTIFTLDANGEYYLGTTSQAYKEMAEYFIKLTNEGLMHPSTMTLDNDQWYATFTSDTSFITYDKIDRMPTFQASGVELNSDFQIAAAAPFNFGSYAATTDVVSVGFPSTTGYSYAIGNTSNIDNVCTYLNWLYSDEGYLMTNWGIEGVSFETDADGNKSLKEGFIANNGGNLTMTGLSQAAMSGHIDAMAYAAAQEEYMREAMEIILPYDGLSPKQYKLSYNESEQFIWDTYATAAYQYATKEWCKFVLGERDMSTWDAVTQELKDTYNLDILLKIHQDALARMLAE